MSQLSARQADVEARAREPAAIIRGLTVDPNSIADRDIELKTRRLGDDVFFDAVAVRNPKPGGLQSDDQTSRGGQHGAIIPWVSSSHTYVYETSVAIEISQIRQMAGLIAAGAHPHE